MAEHVDAAGQLNGLPTGEETHPPGQRQADEDAVDPEADGGAHGRVGGRAKRRVPDVQLAVALGLAALLAVGGLAGWLGFRSYEAHRAHHQRTSFVEVATQAAVNLTTINFTEVDANVARILDSATGKFQEEFQQRSQPFVAVVKQAQSKSEGTVTAAGLQSESGDQAEVLVAVSVKTSVKGEPEQDPRAWRMRISVQTVGEETKVSDVQFVP